MSRAANDVHTGQWLLSIGIKNLAGNPWRNVRAEGMRLAAQQDDYEREAECEPNHGVWEARIVEDGIMKTRNKAFPFVYFVYFVVFNSLNFSQESPAL